MILKSKVLDLYKQLLLTRSQLFQGDTLKLKGNEFRFLNNRLHIFSMTIVKDTLTRLRNDFRVNKNLDDDAKIKQVLKHFNLIL